VLRNLVSNAVKYTEFGTISLKFKYDLETSKFFCTVLDTGVGISLLNRQNLFRPFKKFKETEEMNKKGIGLSLYISKMIVDKLNGTIVL